VAAISDRAEDVIGFTRLYARYESLRLELQTSKPFPHVIVDESFEETFARRLLQVLPRAACLRDALVSPMETRFADDRIDQHGALIGEAFAALRGPRFVAWLQALFDVPDLHTLADLDGGGLHVSRSGNFSEVHADRNYHRASGTYRRVNALVYMNEYWDASWGGDLELWPRDLSHRVTRIAPLFNRAVFFAVNDTAFHGFAPLRLPADVERRSLATYYYSALAGVGQSRHGHETIFPARHDQQARKRLLLRMRSAYVDIVPASLRAAIRRLRRVS